MLRQKQWLYIPLVLVGAALALAVSMLFAWSSNIAHSTLPSEVAAPLQTLTEWTIVFLASVDAVIVVQTIAITLWIGLRDLGAFLPRPVGMILAIANLYVIHWLFDYQAWAVLEVARLSPEPESFRDSFDQWATLARWWTSLFAVAGLAMGICYTACNAWGLFSKGAAHKQAKCWTDLLP